MYESKPYYYGTGRRKHSVARVRVYPGSGKITINNRDIDDSTALAQLMIITWSPQSQWGAKVGLCLPLSIRAAWAATRPISDIAHNKKQEEKTMSTYMPNPQTVERKWYILDAAGKPLGRVAVHSVYPSLKFEFFGLLGGIHMLRALVEAKSGHGL